MSYSCDLAEPPLYMQQPNHRVKDLSVSQPIQVRSKCPGQHHENTHICSADPHEGIFNDICPVEHGELQAEDEAGREVEQEHHRVSPQRDAGPGVAALPDALGPRYHVESNVAVQYEQGADERRYEEVNVDRHGVLDLNEAEGDEDQTQRHLLMGAVPLRLHHDHQGERVHGRKQPRAQQYAVGAGRRKDVTVPKRPAHCSIGVHHHEGDGENGTGGGGDRESRDQLAGQPGHGSPHSVARHRGQVQGEEQHVSCQGVGHQQVARLLAQSPGQKDARQEQRVDYQGGQSDERGGDEKVVQVPLPQTLHPLLCEVCDQNC